jgi:hypothetical protein
MKIKYLGGGWISKPRFDSHMFLLTVGEVYEAIPTFYEDTCYKVIGNCGNIIFLKKEFFEVVKEEDPRIKELKDALRDCKDFIGDLVRKNVTLPYNIWEKSLKLEGTIKTLLKD